MSRPHKRRGVKQTRHTIFINNVVAELKSQPNKLAIIRKNLDEYRKQQFLKRGFLLAIERFDWVFEATNDVEQICNQILADDYIGNRLMR